MDKRYNYINKPIKLSPLLQGSPYCFHYNDAYQNLDKKTPLYLIAYQEQEEVQPKVKIEQEYNKKAKKKGLRTALIIILCISLLLGGGFLWFFRDVIFNRPQASHLGEYYGLFAYAPDVSEQSLFIDYSARVAEFSPQIQAGMAMEATAEEKALAAYIIYRLGCLANATAPYKARYGIGGGSAQGVVDIGSSKVTATGSMNVTATSSEIRYPMSKPESAANIYSDYESYVAGEEYTQIPEGGVGGSDEALIKPAELILRITLPFARRYISTPEYKVVWDAKIGTCVISEERAIADFITRDNYLTKRSQAEIYAEAQENNSMRPYGEEWWDPYGLMAQDMSLHIINPDTILGDTVTITKEMGISINGKATEFYSVEFEIDTLRGRGTPQSATYYAEQFFKAQAPDVFMNFLQDYHLNYSYLKVKFDVFENGYFRTWSTKEIWSMGGRLREGIIAEIISDNESMEAYCYDQDMVMQGFVNRYYGDLSMVDMPLGSLPFHELLQKYTPAEYGSYR